MIDPQELLFVVDKNNNPLEPQIRSTAHKNGLWHRTTGIWVINDKKEILCQKRSLKKDVKPGLWEPFFGGHLSTKQEYMRNAIQEMFEELGMEVTEEELIPYKIFKSKDTHKEFEHIFGLITDKKISDFKLEANEIDELKWVEYTNLLKVLDNPNALKWVEKYWGHEVVLWLVSQV